MAKPVAKATSPRKTEHKARLTGCKAYKSLLNKYDWDVHVASAIMQAESRCVADKNNAGLNYDGSVDYGLMQINSIHADMVSNLGKLYIPEVNVGVAYKLYKAHGWTAWSTYNNGSYLEFL